MILFLLYCFWTSRHFNRQRNILKIKVSAFAESLLNRNISIMAEQVIRVSKIPAPSTRKSWNLNSLKYVSKLPKPSGFRGRLSKSTNACVISTRRNRSPPKHSCVISSYASSTDSLLSSPRKRASSIPRPTFASSVASPVVTSQAITPSITTTSYSAPPIIAPPTVARSTASSTSVAPSNLTSLSPASSNVTTISAASSIASPPSTAHSFSLPNAIPSTDTDKFEPCLSHNSILDGIRERRDIISENIFNDALEKAEFAPDLKDECEEGTFFYNSSNEESVFIPKLTGISGDITRRPLDNTVIIVNRSVLEAIRTWAINEREIITQEIQLLQKERIKAAASLQRLVSQTVPLITTC